MTGLSTFFYFVACPIFRQKFVAGPVLPKNFLAYIDTKFLQKRQVLCA